VLLLLGYEGKNFLEIILNTRRNEVSEIS